jgi:DNA-binding transcriptional ArsR family regulator
MSPRRPQRSVDNKRFTRGRPQPPALADICDDESIDLVFRALNNEVRRGILGVIYDWGPAGMHPSDIAARFDIPWQSVSRHLNVLIEGGLLERRDLVYGRVYTLRADMLEWTAAWLSEIAARGRALDRLAQRGVTVAPIRD